MLCKNRITLIGFLGQDAETRSTPNGTTYTRFSLATSVSWKEKGGSEYKTRTEWHRVISWNKLAEWAGTLQKGAYVEVEGELRYREYTPSESQHSCSGNSCQLHLGARPLRERARFQCRSRASRRTRRLIRWPGMRFPNQMPGLPFRL